MADDDETEETTDEAKDDSSEDGGSDSSSDGKSGAGLGEEETAGEDEDPEFGVKDDEPVNDVQMKYLEPLADELGEDLPDDMSEADAADKINEMQENSS